MDKKREALANFAEVDLEDVTEDGNEYIVDDKTYLVLTDSEADEATAEYIQDSVWAFNADFVAEHTKAGSDITEMIKSFQETRYEDANEPLIALIEDMAEFIDDAVTADGRGHFLSSYDGDENEIMLEGTYYFIYRID